MSEELFDKYLTGSMTSDEAHALTRLLRDNPEAGAAFARHVREASLIVAVGSTLAAAGPARVARGRASRAGQYVAWGAAVAAAAAIAILLFNPFASPSRPPETPPTVLRPNTVGAVPDTAQPKPPVRPGNRLPQPDPPVRVSERPPDATPDPKAVPPARPDETKPPDDREPPPPKRETTVEVARLDRVDGEVYIVRGSERMAAAKGQGLAVDQTLVTAKTGVAVVAFGDGTTVELAHNAEIRDVSEGAEGGGKRIFVACGVVSATVAPQPQDRPMTLLSPGTEVRVGRASLRMRVEAGAKPSTRIEVPKGQVRLVRTADGKGVDIGEGRFAIAEPAADLVVRRLAKTPVVQMWKSDDMVKLAPRNRGWTVFEGNAPGGEQPGARTGLAYSGKGPLPKAKVLHVPLERALAPGTYWIHVSCHPSKEIDVTLGTATQRVECPRHKWSEAILFEVREGAAPAEILVTFPPSAVIKDNGENQDLVVIVHDVFLTSDPDKVPSGDGEILDRP